MQEKRTPTSRRQPTGHAGRVTARRVWLDACGWFDDEDDEWFCEFIGSGKWLANLGRRRATGPSRQHDPGL